MIGTGRGLLEHFEDFPGSPLLACCTDGSVVLG